MTEVIQRVSRRHIWNRFSLTLISVKLPNSSLRRPISTSFRNYSNTGIGSGESGSKMILSVRASLKDSRRHRSARGIFRLRRVERALALAVPQFQQLRFVKDDMSGRPHLEALYAHHRPNAGWQREEHFSDGTLRLLGLLWSLLDSNSLLLLEEPELSLNDAIVAQIPLMLNRVLRESKRQRQVVISTHSEALLSNPGIDARGVLLLEPGAEGTRIRPLNAEEAADVRGRLLGS